MNRSFTLCALGATLTMLAACSSTGTSQTAGTNSATPAQAVASNENMTCRNIIKTGTRLGTRVCKTEAGITGQPRCHQQHPEQQCAERRPRRRLSGTPSI